METVFHFGTGLKYLQAFVLRAPEALLRGKQDKPTLAPGRPMVPPHGEACTGTVHNLVKPPESEFLACNLPAPPLNCPAELFLQLQ